MKIPPIIAVTLLCLSMAIHAQSQVRPIQEQFRQYETSNRNLNSLSENSGLTNLGFWGWGQTYHIGTMGRIVLTNSGPTLLVLDMTDPVHPEVLWEYLAGGIQDIELRDSIVYLTLQTKLAIIDLHDPANPELLSELYIPSILAETRVENQLAYITTQTNKIWIVDVSNPSAPFIRSSFVTIMHYPSSAVRNQRLYVGDEDGTGLGILDARNLDSLTFRTIEPPVGFLMSTAIRDTVILMGFHRLGTTYGDSLLLYSIADPDTPKQISGLRLGSGRSGRIYDISLSADRAYLTTSDSGLYVVNIANPQTPFVTLHQRKPTPPFTELQGIKYSDSLLFFSRGTDIATYRLIGVDSTTLVSVFPTGYTNERVAVRSQTGFVASGFAGLWTVDLSDESRPRRLGNVRNHAYAFDVVADSQYVYLTTGDRYGLVPDSLNQLCVIDVSDPNNPQIVGSCYVKNPYGIAKSGDLIFVSSKRENSPDTILTIVDIHEPSSPIVVGAVVGTYEALELAAQDSVVFLASLDAGLKILDCKTPQNPVFLASFLPQVGGILVEDSLAYVDTMDSLYVINIGNLSAPMNIGSLQKRFSCCNEVEMVKVGTRIGWATYANVGLTDVSDPTQPSEVSHAQNTSAGGIAMYGDTVLFPILSGIRIARWDTSTTSVEEFQELPVQGSPYLHHSYPNPFNSETRLSFFLPERSTVHIEVFNILGEKVITLVDELLDAGEHSRYFVANSYSSGVYLVRLRANGWLSSQRVVLIR